VKSKEIIIRILTLFSDTKYDEINLSDSLGQAYTYLYPQRAIINIHHL
jgi:hypothetical protein